MQEVLESPVRLSHRLRILGIDVDVLNMRSAVDTIGEFIRSKKSKYVCACDVHSIMRAQDDSSHKEALCSADLVLSDGMPLVWVGHLRGRSEMQRVSGPDFMLAVCERSVREGWRHYFLGGADGVAEDVAKKLTRKFPGLNVVGTYCPPFRQMTKEEDEATLARILAAKPHVLWIGLGCPKQELWMYRNKEALQGIVLVGVGAAFDFSCGRVKRAPMWMRTSGLEWLHRLLAEPKRLWRRYLIMAPRFVVGSLSEHMQLMWARRGAH